MTTSLLSRDAVQDMLNSGLSHQAIADSVGCCRSTVSQFIRRNGIKRTEAMSDDGIPEVQCLPDLIAYIDDTAPDLDIEAEVEYWRKEEADHLLGVPMAVTPELIAALIRLRKYRGENVGNA